jgi:Xaa-Pro dipeptidase
MFFKGKYLLKPIHLYKNRKMQSKVPQNELSSRLYRFRSLMNKQNPSWQYAVIFSKINLYYFTGTMQEGMLFIPRNEEATFWVRRSFERAKDESLFPTIKPMDSFRDAATNMQITSDTVFVETEIIPLAFLQRFQKYFPFKEIRPLDMQIAATRAIKSKYELDYMTASGKIHQRILEERVPAMLKEGMNEAELTGELYKVMLEEGHHGIARFSMFDTEVGIGHIAFGVSSIYPTSFNGPGGNYGMGPSVPLIGSKTNKLKKGDLVFIDIGCGVNGYHTDKTMTYMYGKPIDKEAIKAHYKCVDIQDRIAEQLKPGAIPSVIYENIMNNLSAEFLKNFMGFKNRQAKFLGHGIGLHIDELPVIAKGFDEPLVEGVVFAVEPKKGIENVGMVGIENTFLVTKESGKCITGNSRGLIEVF